MKRTRKLLQTGSLRGLFTVLLLLSSQGFAMPEIERTFYRGSGCPSDRLKSSIDPARKVLRLQFEAFRATLGVNPKDSVAVQDCRWTGQLRIPAGFALVVGGASAEGHAVIKDPVRAALHQETLLDGEAQQVNGFSILGPATGPFNNTAHTEVDPLLGKCGGFSTLQVGATLLLRSHQDIRRHLTVVILKTLELPVALVPCSLYEPSAGR